MHFTYKQIVESIFEAAGPRCEVRLAVPLGKSCSWRVPASCPLKLSGVSGTKHDEKRSSPDSAAWGAVELAIFWGVWKDE